MGAPNFTSLQNSIPALPSGQEFSSLQQQIPNLGDALSPVTDQVVAEKALAGTAASDITGYVNLAKTGYANSVNSIIQSQLSSTSMPDIKAAMSMAANYTHQAQTALGAINNIVGLVNNLKGVSTPAQAIAAVNTIIGTLVGVLAAVAPVTAGVGALIAAGVALVASLVESFLSSQPVASVCSAKLDWKPSIVINCVYSNAMGGLDTQGNRLTYFSPGAGGWRRFPEPTVTADAAWFVDPYTVETDVAAHFGWALGGNEIVQWITWQGYGWGCTINQNDDPWEWYGYRLVDRAFPNYKYFIINTSDNSAIENFKRALFVAWKANQEFMLNGLQPMSDMDLLTHVTNLWNAAHEGPMSSDGFSGQGSVVSISPTTGDLQNPNVIPGFHFVYNLSQNFGEFGSDDALHSIWNGALQINTGARKNIPDASTWRAKGIPLVTWNTFSKTVQQTLLSQGLRPQGSPAVAGAPATGASLGAGSTYSTLSTTQKVAVGTVAVAGTAVAGTAVYALVKKQAFSSVWSGIWKNSGGKLLRRR